MLTATLYGKLRTSYVDGHYDKVYNPKRHSFKYKEKRLYRRNKNLFYAELSNGCKVIPKNRNLTDWCSSPWWARWLFPARGNGAHAKYGPAVLIHDDIYGRHVIIGPDGKERPCSKWLADEIMSAVARASGVSQWRIFSMHAIVTIFGHSRWKKGGQDAKR